MLTKNPYCLIGFASGVAGADAHAGEGPIVIQQSRHLSALNKRNAVIKWQEMIKPPVDHHLPILKILQAECTTLARLVASLVQNKQRLCVIGGDHTSAIGTWSGVYSVIQNQGDLGLIWVDAHMDSHTPQTSETGRLHGMPLACLLGYGYSELTTILSQNPKVKPENICLIGVRSYEAGEAKFLSDLGVKVYFMDEVNERGFLQVWSEAIKLVNERTSGYGITIDIDAFDPSIAPGVDVPEPNGLFIEAFRLGLTKIAQDPKLLATEIVEFDPSRDQNEMTEKLIVSLISLLSNQQTSNEHHIENT